MDSGDVINGSCVGCPLHNRKVCIAMTSRHDGLARVSRRRTYEADATIMAEDSAAVAVGTVIRGVVRVTKTLQDGREQVLSFAFPGDFFGRPYFELTEANYESATDVEVCVTDRKRFDQIVQKNPALEHELLKRAFSELAAAHELALLLGSLGAPERVASFLLVTLHRSERPGSVAQRQTGSARRIAVSKVSRRDIARYLGTSIETISRTLHSLAVRGIIRILDSSRFEIVNYGALLAASGVSGKDIDILAHAGLYALNLSTRQVSTLARSS